MLLQPPNILPPIGKHDSPSATPSRAPSGRRVVSSREIASRLNIKIKTEEYHRREIEKSIGVKGTALLVRYLIREGLLEP